MRVRQTEDIADWSDKHVVTGSQRLRLFTRVTESLARNG